MSEAMGIAELETQLIVTVKEVGAMGFGNPLSSISYEKQLKSGELSEAVDGRAAEIITSGEAMRSITEVDDGCIDGRAAVELLYLNEAGEFSTETIKDPSRHERAKVAGGGYMTALAMKRALDLPSGHIDDDIKRVARILAENGIYCGAHTGAHGHDTNTDCGANDKVDAILANGILYRVGISDKLGELLELAGIKYDKSIFEERVLTGWSQTLARSEYFEGSTGLSRFNAVEESMRLAQELSGDYTKPVAVSKHLAGSHKEDYVVINYVKDATFSQAALREKLMKDFPNTPSEQHAQAFVVDVQRIVRLAEAITKRRSEEDFTAALYAGIAYQLATAATLTDGTLRTFVVQ